MGYSSNLGYYECSSIPGFVTTIAGSGSGGFNDGQGTSASLYYPRVIAVDSNGNLYVADFNNHKIRKIYISHFGIRPFVLRCQRNKIYDKWNRNKADISLKAPLLFHCRYTISC